MSRIAQRNSLHLLMFWRCRPPPPEHPNPHTRHPPLPTLDPSPVIEPTTGIAPPVILFCPHPIRSPLLPSPLVLDLHMLPSPLHVPCTSARRPAPPLGPSHAAQPLHAPLPSPMPSLSLSSRSTITNPHTRHPPLLAPDPPLTRSTSADCLRGDDWCWRSRFNDEEVQVVIRYRKRGEADIMTAWI